MEVYSIIANLEEGLLKGEFPTLYDGFIRNKGLLLKYSQEFKNSNGTMFIRKVRAFIREQRKDGKARNSLPITFKSECFEESLSGKENEKKLQVGLIFNKKYRNNSITGLETKQKGPKMFNSPKLVKITRGGKEQLNWKTNIISLGQDITAYHEKIRAVIESRSRKVSSPQKEIYMSSNQKIVTPPYFLNYTLNCYSDKYRG